MTNTSQNLQDGESGLVGTAMYMAPELLKNQLKYTQVYHPTIDAGI